MDLGVLVYVYSRLCHEIVCGVIKKFVYDTLSYNTSLSGEKEFTGENIIFFRS